jgi:hypothetical protein
MVVARTGQVELASRGLTLEAVNRHRPRSCCRLNFSEALDEFGAIHSLTDRTNSNERFTVVVARGGDGPRFASGACRTTISVPMELFETPAPPESYSSPSTAARSRFHPSWDPRCSMRVRPHIGYRWPATEQGAEADRADHRPPEPFRSSHNPSRRRLNIQ